MYVYLNLFLPGFLPILI